MPRCAAVLDDRRLGKQRVEALQILRALTVEDYGWSRHPAVTMWRCHTTALVTYGVAVVDEWTARGHTDTTRELIAEFVHPDPPRTWPELERSSELLPPWWGWEDLHRSHRSALLRKDAGHYGPAFPDTPDDLPYVWPDPPCDPTAPGARVGWVVRGDITEESVSLPIGPDDVAFLHGDDAPRVKRERQLGRFLDDLAPGDPVVVPTPNGLRVGRLTEQLEVTPHALLRGVRWLGTLARASLDRPAALQDPQSVYALRDESALTALLGT